MIDRMKLLYKIIRVSGWEPHHVPRKNLTIFKADIHLLCTLLTCDSNDSLRSKVIPRNLTLLLDLILQFLMRISILPGANPLLLKCMNLDLVGEILRPMWERLSSKVQIEFYRIDILSSAGSDFIKTARSSAN